MKYQKSTKGKKKHYEANKKYQQTKKGKDVLKDSGLRRAYGITLKQHKVMYLEQNGCCGICKQPIAYEKIYVDHRHSDGKIRGLVCCRCNSFVGFIEKYSELINPIKKWLK